jgi:hypothetical protein
MYVDRRHSALVFFVMFFLNGVLSLFK